MPLSIEIIQVLLFVIRFFANNDEDIQHTLDEVLVNGEVNGEALTRLENQLIGKEMRDVLQLMRETMRGNFDRLHEHRDILDRFYKERNLTTSGRTTPWPHWCYTFTQDNNAVVQELKGNIENKYKQPSENSDQPAARSQNHENGSFRSHVFPPEEPELPHPNGPIGNLPAGHMQSPDCCTCGANIQHTGTLRQLEITDVLKELTPQQWKGFVAKLNDYPFILAHTASQFFASTVTADAFIITLVLQPHLSGRKCIFCLLRKALEHIGRGDLARKIRAIMHRKS